MPRPLSPLPVDTVLPAIAAGLSTAGAVVLRAPTGSGKTTRVPPALLASVAHGRRVLVLEPRRLAARAAARRVAEERGWALGGEVGYQVRFDRRVGEATRLVYLTEGILVRRLQEDPFLEGVGALVFDEIHERSLQADLALGMARRVQGEVRPDLSIVAMSATVDPGPLAAYLGGCPVLETHGRLHPVEIRHAGRPVERDRRSLAAAVVDGVRELLGDTAGDLLVFLPGVGEIRAAEDALEPFTRRFDLALLHLHGGLPLAEQDAVLRPGPRRKVILATNVAESSVTVEGVTGVVDTGLARTLRYDPASGLDRLELGRISRASADQRAGRAGRVEPGVCLRLWPEIEDSALPERDVPEVARVDLAGAVLELLAWGESDPAAFPWLDPPRPEALARAEELLEQLGAVAGVSGRGVTATGRLLARMPVHPRLGRLLLEGARRGVGREAALLAALLSERSPFVRGSGEGSPGPGQSPGQSPPRTSRSDLLDRLEVLEALEATGRPLWDHPFGRLNRGAARFLFRSRDQLAGLLAEAEAEAPSGDEAEEGSTEPEGGGAEAREEALLRAVFAAFPDRLARRRERGSAQGVMVGGRGVRLARESAVVEPELFVAADLDAGRPGERSEALVRLASAVERDWLPADALRVDEEVTFDPGRERVVAHRITRYRDLELERREVPAGGAEAARVLVDAAEADLAAALALDDPELASLLERTRFLRRWVPELDLPELGRPALLELLPALAGGRRSFAELRRAPVAAALRGRLSHAQLQALDREAPERLEVPSGHRLRLVYRGEEPPVLAVRIQELFGLSETPRVARGRVPILLHLLAPNMRPQQVTDDLESFWTRTYAEVRKELAGRYPKHHWPEDPLKAKPEGRPGEHRRKRKE